MSEQTEVTTLLLAAADGDSSALERLVPIVYGELRRIAHRRLGGERPDHTLSTTELVHEAYLKLANLDRLNWKNRAQFMAIVSLYALEPTSGKMKLAGFDYFIPGPLYAGPDSPEYPGQPPVLQGLGTPMTWDEAHGGWVAHAWPWMHNPDGMFDDYNPSVPLCECEITPETPLCTP